MVAASQDPERTVLDWNNVVVGTILEFRHDPRTRAVQSLLVRLSEDARARLGAERGDLEIPVDYVVGVRRGEVTLDRSVEQMRRFTSDAANPDASAMA